MYVTLYWYVIIIGPSILFTVAIVLLAAVLIVLLAAVLLAIGYHQYSQQNSLPVAENHMKTSTEIESFSFAGAFASNNLPTVHGPFVGRNKEWKEISDMLIHPEYSGITMVSIYGGPAVGKSRLAIHVGYTLATHGITVRYININDARYLFNEPDDYHQSNTMPTKSKFNIKNTNELTLSDADIVLSLYSNSEYKYVPTSARTLLEWAKGLKNDTLLILDNCDSFLQDDTQEHHKMFKETLKSLHEASKHVRMITTSRIKLTILGGCKAYRLRNLDNNSAIELLQHESKSLTTQESSEIAELVGNNPLALIIAAYLVSDDVITTQEMIGQLRQNMMKTLSPDTNADSQKILPVLELSYNYLNNSTQLCIHYLSLFPGSFSRQAGISILSTSNLTDPESCVMRIADRSLLEVYKQTGESRYQLHNLIKDFLRFILKTSNLRTAMQALKVEFSWNYQTYYSSLCANLSELFTKTSNKMQIVAMLENDVHNLQKLFEMLNNLQLSEMSIVNVGYILCSDLLSELRIEVFRYLQKIIYILDQRLLDIVQVIGVNTGLHVYVELLSQASKHLESFDRVSVPLCLTMCEKIFTPELLLLRWEMISDFNDVDEVNVQKLFMKFEELEAYDAWLCAYYCGHATAYDLHAGIQGFIEVKFVAIHILIVCANMEFVFISMMVVHVIIKRNFIRWSFIISRWSFVILLSLAGIIFTLSLYIVDFMLLSDFNSRLSYILTGGIAYTVAIFLNCDRKMTYICFPMLSGLIMLLIDAVGIFIMPLNFLLCIKNIITMTSLYHNIISVITGMIFWGCVKSNT